MTADHLDALLDAVPDAQSHTSLLDPEGSDVPDPIGSDHHTYRQTAQTMERMLEERLAADGALIVAWDTAPRSPSRIRPSCPPHDVGVSMPSLANPNSGTLALAQAWLSLLRLRFSTSASSRC